MASVGAILGKNDIVSASVICVALDQTLWWVDVLTFVLTQKFRVGVAKYLIWPETTWNKIITSTHHLWFIPVCAYFNDGLALDGLKLSVLMVLYLSVFTRMCVPFEINFEGKAKYMNINCTYECWKDVKLGILHIADRKFHIDHNFLFSFVWLNSLWNAGNALCFLMMKYLFSI